MFTYLFPIFCFGLIITGIVCLGIIEANREARALARLRRQRLEDLEELERQFRSRRQSKYSMQAFTE